MKKILTVVIVLFGLAGLLFANSIIPTASVLADDDPYPPIQTIMPPDYPPDYWYIRREGFAGTIVGVCHECIGWGPSNYTNFIMHVTWFSDNNGWNSYWGFFAYTQPNGNPVYEFHIPDSFVDYGELCYNFDPSMAIIDDGLGNPITTLIYIGPDPTNVCGSAMPFSVKGE